MPSPRRSPARLARPRRPGGRSRSACNRPAPPSRCEAAGISYGAGLARYLQSEGHVVIEVIRPNRQARRRHGKSDPADADAARGGQKPGFDHAASP